MSKKIKETKHDRELRKACALNPGMQVRDYYGAHLASDMQDHIRDFAQYIDVKEGDHVMLISFKWKSAAHRARASRQTKRLFKKYFKKI